MGAFDSMTKVSATICPISPAHLTGLAAIKVSIILAFFHLELGAIPLILYLIICTASSLMPASRFFLPVISHGHTGKKIVAMTFDDGPDPATTGKLLELLSQYSVRATFFIPGRRASLYPELVRDILARGHDIGNHSFNHNPFLMLRRMSDMDYDITSGQKILETFGVVPLTFRPPVGVTNPKLWRILLRLGMVCVTFSCRAGDFGNRRIKGLAGRILSKAKPDDIIMLHDVMPRQGMDVDLWLQELSQIIEGFRHKGLSIVGLSEVIGQPVMGLPDTADALNPVVSFYNKLAEGYDKEQFDSGVSMAKRKEYEVVSSRLPALVSSTDRILEIGAGTGIFSIPIARLCHELVAVDVSKGMLAVLEQKAIGSHINNIKCVAGDIMAASTPGTFDMICGFSSLEYIPDLSKLLTILSHRLNPGGVFYFTTAHRSPFRFFTQVGNAMRQGLWLHARSEKEVIRMLNQAGMQPVRMKTHLLNVPPWGGMILEFEARKNEAP